MYAGGQVVCNQFFRQAFGVSNNTIESAKRNPQSDIVQRRCVNDHEFLRDLGSMHGYWSGLLTVFAMNSYHAPNTTCIVWRAI